MRHSEHWLLGLLDSKLRSSSSSSSGGTNTPLYSRPLHVCVAHGAHPTPRWPSSTILTGMWQLHVEVLWSNIPEGHQLQLECLGTVRWQEKTFCRTGSLVSPQQVGQPGSCSWKARFPGYSRAGRRGQDMSGPARISGRAEQGAGNQKQQITGRPCQSPKCAPCGRSCFSTSLGAGNRKQQAMSTG